ncbi:polysaccharide deacetylase family protein [Paenibacillus sp. NEAU-GSW1]|uniref:polysaccharide deacetylase family protein n=1 Tax=Paenibacillus sp. NEAU-GSW1 TaxID=2682486 RepID=UPI0012E20641|nr:polysaccharide deacetylase family protein [Paenibacillus sp. NEAU-GSW1]MUT66515.1 polysaccharide deacetylase family protein [Paenibacillus sp. NEAU-GSW1]
MDNKIRMIELLSLRQDLDLYLLELRVTAGEAHDDVVLEIDEHTYHQLKVAVPRQEERKRVRLSLYPKRDAYLNGYNSSLTIADSTGSRQLLFTCTDNYALRLEQLLRDKAEAALLAVVGNHTASGDDAEKESKRRARVRRIRTIAGRLAVLSLVFVMASIGFDRKLFVDDDPINNTVAAASSGGQANDERGSGGTADVVLAEAGPKAEKLANDHVSSADAKGQTPVAVTTADVKQPEQPESSPKPDKLFETVQVDADEAKYSLPKGYVALTFDDGPSAYTEQIVDILQEHDVAATFLFIGVKVKQNSDAVAYASERQMAVGNHSWDHSDLAAVKPDKAKEELELTNKVLEKITGRAVTLFRPPYGSLDDQLQESVSEQKLNVLMWNRDPEDWSVKNATDIVDYFRQTDPSGGIYVLHEKKITVEALPEIIQYLKKKKLKFAVFE